ncbi:MAG: hypothetical protein RMJ59_02090 [Candidatus Nitrosocaldus sp.]|nr:hypothetical protein [Candidatus Nitrosocaldus sp.]MCS7141559.1 hypothetical protein [Candidatus Nitrosocaldus sp.]MDW8000321.1 hypothetical protein [Candidatus Nitrosocaldus sp.]MDW8275157.1 hypothetical protein [Candidatus Nitrosocaldus sp.]
MVEDALTDSMLYALAYMMFPLLTLIGMGAYAYYSFKRRLRAIRRFIDTLDDALYDDRISEDEFRALWSKFKAVVKA